jgi:hypothetical protein
MTLKSSKIRRQQQPAVQRQLQLPTAAGRVAVQLPALLLLLLRHDRHEGDGGEWDHRGAGLFPIKKINYG